MGMSLEPSDLWPGEQALLSKAANLVIRIKEHGLSQFAFDKYMFLIGMKGKEALGGLVHLTSYRLIFKSHGLNRLRGKISIFLPNVAAVTNTSWFVVRKVKVETQAQDYEMVLWGIPSFIAAVEEAKAKIGPKEKERLKQLILGQPEMIGEGLAKWVAAERINKVLLAVRKGASLAEEVSDVAGLGSDEQRTFFEVLSLFL
jgi:hypothetical protein